MSIQERDQHGVRFSTQNEEISPEISLHSVETLTGREYKSSNPETDDDIQQLKTSLQNAVQSRRMEHYSFEPVSLPGSQPVSRVCLVNFP